MNEQFILRKPWLVFVILLVCGLGIYFLPFIDENYRAALSSEIIGSGVIAFIVAYIFLKVEKLSSYEERKKSIKQYFKEKVLFELFETVERGIPPYILDDGRKTYFGNTYINTFFDRYEDNFLQIREYMEYETADVFAKDFTKLYKKTKIAYITGEKLENRVRKLVREYNFQKQIHSSNDVHYLMYVKGKLKDFPDSKLLLHLNWQSVPENVLLMCDQIRKDSDVVELVKRLNSQLSELVPLCDSIRMSVEKQVIV